MSSDLTAQAPVPPGHRPGLPKQHWAALFLPLLVGLIVASSALYMAREQVHAERHALEQATFAGLREVSGTVEASMEAQIAALGRLHRRWVVNRGMSQGAFEPHAAALVRDFGFIRAIQWVDESFEIRWQVSPEGSPSVVGRSLAEDPAERKATEAARDRRGPTVSPPLQLLSNGQGFVIAFPLWYDGEFHGFIFGSYSAAPALSKMLAHVGTAFDISIASGTRTFWSRTELDADPVHTRVGEITLLDQVWALSATPGPEMVDSYLTPVPWGFGASGAILGALLAYALRAAWLGRLRNKSLRLANDTLSREFTRRTRAEVGEREARDELATVVNSLPAYVWSAIAQPDGSLKMRYQSSFLETITGLTPEAFHNREGWIRFVHDDDRERVAATFRALLSGETDEDSSEYRFVRHDGEVRHFRQHVRATAAPDGRRLFGIAADITETRLAETERRQIEASLQETQRLESLGVLAGGIAHDFNNLLVAMLGHAALARQDLAPDSAVQKSLSRIEKAAHQAAELCRQMLAYAGMGTMQRERADLCNIVEEMAELLRASIPRTIEIKWSFDDAPVGVDVDTSQLRQVILNLITNAAEAIGPETGQIRISVQQIEIDEATLDTSHQAERLMPGQYALLRVQDDGCGMDDSTRRRIFDPFFTTKFQGRGLGLAAVLGIVKRSGGAVHIESAPGEGTTMEVILPIVSLEGTSKGADADDVQALPVFGRVLVVEDDPGAREFASLVLEREGFEVAQAADGVEGLEVFDKHLHDVVCVVLDLTMPRMDGVEATRRVRQVRPGVAVVLCSGYPESDAVRRFGDLGIDGFLQKPYAPGRLVDVVQAAISQARSRSLGAGSSST